MTTSNNNLDHAASSGLPTTFRKTGNHEVTQETSFPSGGTLTRIYNLGAVPYIKIAGTFTDQNHTEDLGTCMAFINDISPSTLTKLSDTLSSDNPGTIRMSDPLDWIKWEQSAPKEKSAFVNDIQAGTLKNLSERFLNDLLTARPTLGQKFK